MCKFFFCFYSVIVNRHRPIRYSLIHNILWFLVVLCRIVFCRVNGTKFRTNFNSLSKYNMHLDGHYMCTFLFLMAFLLVFGMTGVTFDGCLDFGCVCFFLFYFFFALIWAQNNMHLCRTFDGPTFILTVGLFKF